MGKDKIIINATDGVTMEEIEKTRKAIERANSSNAKSNDVLDYVKNYGSRELAGRLKQKGMI